MFPPGNLLEETMIRQSRALAPFACTLLLFTLGCGDVTSTTGEEGNIGYALHTDYDSLEDDLTEVGIITGHQQLLSTSLTSAGEEEVEDPGTLEHSVSPTEGCSLELVDSEGNLADFLVTATTPGEYTFESTLDGELFDRITLRFDDPSSLEILTWVRAPGAEEFHTANGVGTSVEEGAQATFVLIPMDAAGDRLAGDIDTTWSADPSWAVVPGENVYGVYEQSVWSASSPFSIYFIEPGPVAMTIMDPINALDSTVDFVVEPVDTGE